MVSSPTTATAAAPDRARRASWSARCLCAFVLAVGATGPSRAQSTARPELPDPRRTVVIVDDAGNVGLRISDAQGIHELVIARLRKRLGNDAVAYEGARKNAEQMKRMLGPQAETQIQDAQLAWHDAAAAAAPWRVRVRFGQKKSEHWITVACRKASDDTKKPVDERRFVGRTFVAAREAANAGLDAFCTALPTAAMMIPVEQQQRPPGEIPGLRKKAGPAPWTPPPRRD